MGLLASIGNLLLKAGAVVEIPTTSAPGTPDAGQSRVWADSTTKTVHQIDESGLVWQMRAPPCEGEMYEYDNATVLGIDTTNVYHPLFNTALVTGYLDGWTFSAGAAGTFTAIADLGGSPNQVRVTTAAPHTMTAGMIVSLTGSTVAGYLTQAATANANENFYVIQNVSDNTHFDIVSANLGTATGNWTKPATLVAGADAAGKYELSWSASFQPASPNKLFKFEPRVNVTPEDKAVGETKPSAADPRCAASSCYLTIAAGDRVCMTAKNKTDATDVTIIHCNIRVRRYSR
jgi:hypothetical protein